ncbi:MAG: hypothetical protein HQ541_13045 [Mariniphaga sp.]|nr:hypothetical protein [Mariniphaga sp.]
MITKIKKSKKVIIRIVLIAILVGGAFILDNYFETHPVNIDLTENNGGQPVNTQGAFVLYNPVNFMNVKQDFQKVPFRIIHSQRQDKFLQKHHQQRNFHALKDESLKQKVPIVLSYHFLVFRGNYSSLPDNEPSNS